jgi:hypothetical protein
MNFGFHKISAADYHADKLADQPTLSSSIAKIILKESALKAWHAHPRLNPAFKEEHDDKFDLGTCAHQFLLENDASRVVVVEANDWRTNKAKEEREAARAAGKTALLASHYADVRQMVDAAHAFLADCEISADWKNGESEVTGLVEDDGVMLKAKFDRITRDRKVIIDYKSTGSAAPDIFGMQIARLGYHWQEAFYRRVANLLGAQRPIFVFMAQSVEPPYECSLHGCDPAMQEIADADVKHAIALWRDCMARNKWPSYGGRIYWTMPTSWQMSAHEQRLQEAA